MPPRKGTPWSEARRAADTLEYRQRLSQANKGKEPWNKGLDQRTGLPKLALPEEEPPVIEEPEADHAPTDLIPLTSTRSPSRDLCDYIRLRDGSICIYCEESLAVHVEHVVPRSKGGRNLRGNLVMSCARCNMKKKGRLDTVFMAKAFLHLSKMGEDLSWVDKMFTS